ncbi:pentatricopeptide repeat-containing protein At2g40720 [Rhodamnia argentea]|uniref:Pentatricopeptide repeat-containing protein At2g40720 n=1 Tax=Rhodamnia argentea TaxID=178133 RepID=A0A8B8Q098_9MYRT|nr:pentatricopeptide repeat-containing protein At2g40720 [Rhodamnia argentea]
MYFNPIFTRRLSTLTKLHPSTSLVNSKIKSLVRQSQYTEALKLYSPENATKFTFPSLLKACASLRNLCYGKTVHSSVIALGLRDDLYIASSLIDMYVKCGSLDDAIRVFDELTESQALSQDVTIWNSLIKGYCRYGHLGEGICKFGEMQLLGVRPDEYTLSILLGVCDGHLGCMQGKQIHGYAVRNMFSGDTFLETALIDMYSSCGRLRDAFILFDNLVDRSNVVAWNVLISRLTENNLWGYSLRFYSLAKNENVNLVSATFSSALSACCCGEDMCFGRQVHCDVIKMGFHDDPYVSTATLTMYAKCGSVRDAECLFSQLEREIELWNAMISAYVGHGHFNDAIEAYNQMRASGTKLDSVTFSNILTSCSMALLPKFGRSVHADLSKRPIQNNVATQSSLLTMYSKCGHVEDANLVFSCMTERDVVAWGSMISGFCQNGKYKEAIGSYKGMENDGIKPDSNIMASVIDACAGLEKISLGKAIHGSVIKSGLESDTFVSSSLIDLYSKCGWPDTAAVLFSNMPHKNLVSWNSMMSCYSRNDLPELSVRLFSQIAEQGKNPDSVSVSTVLAAISSLASLLKGKTVHGYLVRQEILWDLQVENGLINMYIKSGCINYAEQIFQKMPQRNLVTWNSMISGYGHNGDYLKSIQLFDEMRILGIEPDKVTFRSLISSCRHSGLVEEGLKLFDLMKEGHHIEPETEDYVNIIDLLGRAGRLGDAYNFIESMSMVPDRSVWLCLLSACRIHRSVELGEVAASNLLRIEPDTGSNHVQLLNLYGEAELREQAAQFRASMKEKGLRKSPGCSWIELRDRVDVFYSGGLSTQSTGDICNTLTNLNRNMGKIVVDDTCLEAF